MQCLSRTRKRADWALDSAPCKMSVCPSLPGHIPCYLQKSRPEVSEREAFPSLLEL